MIGDPAMTNACLSSKSIPKIKRIADPTKIMAVTRGHGLQLIPASAKASVDSALAKSTAIL
jgi:hypothetical protein